MNVRFATGLTWCWLMSAVHVASAQSGGAAAAEADEETGSPARAADPNDGGKKALRPETKTHLRSSSKEADWLANEGLDLQEKGKHEAAYQKFVQAMELQPRVDIAAALGHSALKTKRYATAADHLQYAVTGLGGNDPRQAESYRDLDLARKQVSTVTLTLRPPSGQLSVDGVPLSGGVYDVHQTGASSRVVHLMPGPHRVRLEASGYIAAERPVEAAAGAKDELVLSLSSVDDGRPDGEGADQTTAIAVTTTLGVATVGLVVAGGVFFAMGEGEVGDADDLRGQDPRCATVTCPAVISALEDADQNRNLGVGLMIGGGAAAIATGVVAYLFWGGDDDEDDGAPKEARRPGEPQAPRLWAQPYVDPQRWGLSVGGEF